MKASPAVLLLVLASACSNEAPPVTQPEACPGAAVAAHPGVETDESLTVSGPITGGKGAPFTASAADLEGAGYSEEEFFFEGEAVAYALEGEMTTDGKWALGEASAAPFKSRLLVRRPEDACQFNGTVIVEWLNVSGGADGDPGFMYNAEDPRLVQRPPLIGRLEATGLSAPAGRPLATSLPGSGSGASRCSSRPRGSRP